MGFIRGSLIILVSIALLISFLAMNLSLTFNLSLQYENVKDQAGETIQRYVLDGENFSQKIDSRYPQMQTYCANNPNSEYVFSEDDFAISVLCESVSEGKEKVLEDSAESLIQSVYYKEYDCNFFSCLKEEGKPFFLVSEKTKDYWRGKFILALTISLILIATIFLLAEKKRSTFFISGGLLILSSLPFIRLGTGLLSSIDSTVLVFANIFFSKSQDVFVIAIISGTILIVIGILMKLFMAGFKLSKWIENIRNKNSLSQNKDNIKKENSNKISSKKK